MILSEKEVQVLVELAKECEIGDPFDWANVAIDEEEAYKLMAMNVLSMNMNRDIMAATVVKLCVENMVLNLKLMQNVNEK
jgi:hypothetical protein